MGSVDLPWILVVAALVPVCAMGLLRGLALLLNRRDERRWSGLLAAQEEQLRHLRALRTLPPSVSGM